MRSLFFIPVVDVLGHGYISLPETRQSIQNLQWCKQCANEQTTVCGLGGYNNAPSSYQIPAKNHFVAGEAFDVDVHITAPHGGAAEMFFKCVDHAPDTPIHYSNIQNIQYEPGWIRAPADGNGSRYLDGFFMMGRSDRGYIKAKHRLPASFPACKRGVGVWRWRTGNSGCVSTWADGVEANGGICPSRQSEKTYRWETFANCFEFTSTSSGQGSTLSISTRADSPTSTVARPPPTVARPTGTVTIAGSTNIAANKLSPVSVGSSTVYEINIQEVYEGITRYVWAPESDRHRGYKAFENCWGVVNLQNSRFAEKRNTSPWSEDRAVCLSLRTEKQRPTYKLKTRYYPTGKTSQVERNADGTITPLIVRSKEVFSINVQELYDALSNATWVDGETAYKSCWASINSVHSRFAAAKKLSHWSEDKSICLKLRFFAW